MSDSVSSSGNDALGGAGSSSFHGPDMGVSNSSDANVSTGHDASVSNGFDADDSNGVAAGQPIWSPLPKKVGKRGKILEHICGYIDPVTNEECLVKFSKGSNRYRHQLKLHNRPTRTKQQYWEDKKVENKLKSDDGKVVKLSTSTAANKRSVGRCAQAIVQAVGPMLSNVDNTQSTVSSYAGFVIGNQLQRSVNYLASGPTFAPNLHYHTPNNHSYMAPVPISTPNRQAAASGFGYLAPSPVFASQLQHVAPSQNIAAAPNDFSYRTSSLILATRRQPAVAQESLVRNSIPYRDPADVITTFVHTSDGQFAGQFVRTGS